MKARAATSALMSALIALSMTATGFAVAQDRPDSRDHRGEGQRSRDGPGDAARDPGNSGQNDRHNGERGAGPNHGYYRGDRLPPEARRRQDVVSDWRGRHLSEPPRGYHWVRTGNDYVLAAITTGVILQLMLGQ